MALNSEAEKLAASLEAEKITIEEFQVGLFELTKKVFVSGMLVFGFTYADYYAKQIQEQINYIDRFGLDIKNGRVFGSLAHRAKLYILSGMYFFEEILRKQAILAGYKEERRICSIEEFSTDWQKIGLMKNISDGVIGKGCDCRYEFRA